MIGCLTLINIHVNLSGHAIAKTEAFNLIFLPTGGPCPDAAPSGAPFLRKLFLYIYKLNFYINQIFASQDGERRLVWVPVQEEQTDSVPISGLALRSWAAVPVNAQKPC
jgi:hypothetical protein